MLSHSTTTFFPSRISEIRQVEAVRKRKPADMQRKLCISAVFYSRGKKKGVSHISLDAFAILHFFLATAGKGNAGVTCFRKTIDFR